MFLPQETESSSAGSQSSPSAAPWDSTLNRALNVMKKKDKFSKPSSAGRVAGQGLTAKWSDYYKPGRKDRRTTSLENQEVKELREKVAQLPQMVEQQVGAALNNMIPVG